MRTVHALIAAGQTDTGRQRDVNEDRFYCDAARGLFIVIDGVGGQAAGGKAADVALSTLRKRLEREMGPVAQRVREAITNANNEIYRLAGTRPEWNGMACVLTVAVIDNGSVTIGHVGDTRLYKLRNHGLEKITRDHSPVGEREDAGEPPFATPRNAAAGTMRNLDPSLVSRRGLAAFTYQLVANREAAPVGTPGDAASAAQRSLPRCRIGASRTYGS